MEKVDEPITTNYLVPQGTTHLMMWFGGELPDKRIIKYRHKQKPQYQVCRDDEKKCVYVDYVKTLKEECKKMEQNGEACILVYDSKMIDNTGRQKMKDIVKDIPNCYLVDFEDFLQTALTNNIQFEGGKSFSYDYGDIIQTAKSKKISDFIEHLRALIESNKNNVKFTCKITRDCIGNLVDCARMLLLLNPSRLKQLAIDSNKEDKKTIQPKTNDFSLLYHDFDIIQKNTINKTHDNNPELKKHNYLIFTTGGMDYSSGICVENGIIFVNSLNDRNAEIENMIHKYINYEDNDVSNSNGIVNSKKFKFSNKYHCTMYEDIIYTDYRHLNNFNYQYYDEGHRTWCYKNISLNNEQHTNNKPKYELKESLDRTIKNKLKWPF